MPYRQEWIDRGTDRIGLQWYAEPDSPDAPMLVLWPAMGVPARFYRPFATALRQAGLVVVVADLRGTGASTPKPSRSSRYGYADLVDDVGEVLTHLAPHRSGRRLVLLGHSLGGQACLLHLARSGRSDVDGLALVAAGLPYWRRYPPGRRLLVLPATQAIGATAALLRIWPGWGFGGRQAHGVIRDWAFTARTGRFPHLAGEGPEPALASVPTPVLAVSFAHDRLVPPQVVDHLAGLLTAAPVQRVHYDGGANHFTWARSPEHPVTAEVARFSLAPDPVP